MNPQIFQEILLNTLVGNQEVIEQASNSLLQIKEQDYEAFINLELNSILNPINERVPQISIVHLYREAKTGQLFCNENIAIGFYSNFVQNITNLLLSDNINEHFKITLASILAILHGFIFKTTQNVSILSYILTTYEQLPQLKKYLMNCAYEICISSPDLGGFSIDDLLIIIHDDLPNQELFIPRIHLYFSLVKYNPEDQRFHALFNPLIIEPISTLELCLPILKSIANFADINGYFFTPHAPLLFDNLICLSLNRENSDMIRNLSILCIMSIVKNAPEMCKSLQNMYQIVMAPLVLIVSEVEDDSPWEYDPNDISPCIQALDAISMIDETLQSQDGFNIVYQIYQPILNPNCPIDPNSPLFAHFKYGINSWQAKYALISSLSAMMNFFCDFNYFQQLFEFLVPCLNPQVHPRIRVASYRYIKGACGGMSQIEQLAKVINDVFQAAFAEDLLITKQNAFKTLAFFFSQPTIQSKRDFVYEHYFVPYFNSLLNELMNQQPDINKYVVQCIGYMAQVIKTKYAQFFSSTTERFWSLLQNSMDFSFSIKIIHSFAISLTHITLQDQNIIGICINFLQVALQLYGSERTNNEEELDELINAICIFLEKLSEYSAPFTMDAMPRVLEIAFKQIPIEQADTLDSIYSLKSIYIQIPSSDSSLKLYVSRNDVMDVKQALKMLYSIINSNPNNTQYFVQIMDIAKHWICLEYFIEDIVLNSWHILFAFLRTKEGMNTIYIEFLLKCYIESQPTLGSPAFLSTVLLYVSKALKLAQHIGWSNAALFEIILNGLPDLTNHAINAKLKYSTAMITYDNYDFQDQKLICINKVLERINDLIKRCFKISCEMTYNCLAETIIPNITGYLNNYELLVFSVTFIYNLYYFTMPDINNILNFSTIIVNKIIELTPDLTKCDAIEHLLHVLGNICYIIKLENQTNAADWLTIFFNNYISNIDIDIDENESISDFANVAFSKFLLSNLNNTSDQLKAVEAWDQCQPLWDQVIDSEYYFEFMVFLIEEGKILDELGIYWVESYLQPILKCLYIDKLSNKIFDESNFEKYGEKNLKKIGKALKIELQLERGKKILPELLTSYPEGEIKIQALINYSELEN